MVAKALANDCDGCVTPATATESGLKCIKRSAGVVSKDQPGWTIMADLGSDVAFSARRLVTIIATGLLVATAFGNHALAQGAGGTATSNGESRGLQDILVSPPTAGLNIIAAPYYSVEHFDAYTNDATVFFETPFFAFGSGDVVPAVDIHTIGGSVGADYLFANGGLLGFTIDVSDANYDYDAVNLADAAQALIDLGEGLSGIPDDRDATSIGGTVAVGFIDGPLTVLGTVQYKHTNYETRRSELFLPLAGPIDEVDRLEADFDSDMIAGDVTAGYRIELGIAGITIQPYGRMRFQAERIDDYSEEYVRTDEFDPVTGEIVGPVGPFPTINQRRTFTEETILSFPGTLGLNVTVPVPLGGEGIDARVTIGSSFTHDFASQDRNVDSFDPVGAFQPAFPLSIRVEKQNRDTDKASVTGAFAVDWGLASLRFNYQHDFGFDERDSADTLSAHLRIRL